MWLSVIIAFNMGLLSSLHCLGMCGGIITALMKANPNSDANNTTPLKNSIAYNLGRILSYCIAGAIAGIFGTGLASLVAQYQFHLLVQIVTSLVLILLALSLVNLISFSRLELWGQHIWRRIQPISQRLLPIDSFGKAMLFGMVWGWLPCGLVYSALLLSITMGTVYSAVIIMFCFGLGTLPSMVSAGFISEHIQQSLNQRQLRWISAILLILLAISLPLSTYYYSGHHASHLSTDQHSAKHHIHHH